MAVISRNPEREPNLSILVVFHNMPRESLRTLYSLTDRYQRQTESLSYEVIVLDNGSSERLDEAFVGELGDNFHYVYYDARTPSPCEALNYGGRISRGEWLTLCIDGARILSPGILYHSVLASRIHANVVVYTLSMHIGERPQNLLAEEGYSREDEDRLVASVDWQADGYSLFDISSPALSSKDGYFSKLTETNCITMSRATFQQLGGFDERFRSPGGGLANLDFFNRANQLEDACPVMLLGEATFHQFHGGVATNVPLRDHPFPRMAEEYEAIRGTPYAPYERKPLYFGTIHPRCLHLLAEPREAWQA